jgi:NADPH oxidase 2
MASYGGYSNRSSSGSLKQTERSRWTPLHRMLLSGEMTQEIQKELSGREKFNRWMVNEGYRRM